MKNSFFAIFIVLFVSSLAAAQATVSEIKAGQELARASKVEARSEEFVSYISDKGRRTFSSFLMRTVRLDEVNGRQVFTIQQNYDLADGPTVDTSVVDRKTLEPISYRSQAGKESESFDFSPGRVQGTIVAEDGSTKSVDMKPENPIFNVVVLETLIQALPLGEKYQASLHAYNPGRQSFKIVLTVTGSETINGTETWVVKMEGAAAPTTLWIEKKAQTSIRQKTLLRNGAEFWQIRLR